MTTPNTPNAAERPSAAQIIAAELARIDGYDPDDQHGGLYDLRWSGGPNPEPEGDAWSMDYLPKGERVAAALESFAKRSVAPPAQAVSVPEPGYLYALLISIGTFAQGLEGARFEGRPIRDCISDVIGQLAGEEVSTAPAAATREGKE